MRGLLTSFQSLLSHSPLSFKGWDGVRPISEGYRANQQTSIGLYTVDAFDRVRVQPVSLSPSLPVVPAKIFVPHSTHFSDLTETKEAIEPAVSSKIYNGEHASLHSLTL